MLQVCFYPCVDVDVECGTLSSARSEAKRRMPLSVEQIQHGLPKKAAHHLSQYACSAQIAGDEDRMWANAMRLAEREQLVREAYKHASTRVGGKPPKALIDSDYLDALDAAKYPEPIDTRDGRSFVCDASKARHKQAKQLKQMREAAGAAAAPMQE